MSSIGETYGNNCGGSLTTTTQRLKTQRCIEQTLGKGWWSWKGPLVKTRTGVIEWLAGLQTNERGWITATNLCKGSRGIVCVLESWRIGVVVWTFLDWLVLGNTAPQRGWKEVAFTGRPKVVPKALQVDISKPFLIILAKVSKTNLHGTMWVYAHGNSQWGIAWTTQLLKEGWAQPGLWQPTPRKTEEAKG